VAGLGILLKQRGASVTERGSIDRSSVVMLGDSITEQGRWLDLLPEFSIANRGYSGFTTEELVDIADDVAPQCPRMVFVLAGTNDIRDGRSPEWTRRHLAEILDRFESCSAVTQVVMHTIPPRADAVTRVAATNAAITELAFRRGTVLIDLHQLLDDGAGGLRPNDTTDQIHLSEPGYHVWVEEIRRVLRIV
jgi:lysophospholipase L1-like esterase